MAKLIYSAIASLDGYVADEDGNFDWALPNEEVHAFVNDLHQPLGTYLYGRRMYETMVGWETDPTLAERSLLMRNFAQIWQAADKVVYSKTLQAVSTARTRIERVFDPEAVRRMKASAGRDLLAFPEVSEPRLIRYLANELLRTPLLRSWVNNPCTDAPGLPQCHHGTRKRTSRRSTSLARRREAWRSRRIKS